MLQINLLARITLMLGFICAPLCAETWYFEDTTIVGTRTGDGTVTGYVTLNGANWSGPTYIDLTGPFGTFTDLGAQLQLDEGDSEWTDSTVIFGTTIGASTPGLTVDPLLNFSFTSVFGGSLVTDTYSLVSGKLTTVNPTPEPGTAPEMLIGALGLAGLAVHRRYLARSSR
jgi:MYXO-CTERM domain-containing protein